MGGRPKQAVSATQATSVSQAALTPQAAPAGVCSSQAELASQAAPIGVSLRFKRTARKCVNGSQEQPSLIRTSPRFARYKTVAKKMVNPNAAKKLVKGAIASHSSFSG
ncbi:hypothetical protein TIFTF001_049924 [Ficus carica]|uniref:Uncharacterized protein n=1 Tax=Ficus carica TaxID=3494 RepID=A0AA87YNZ7_FICCA|nr:hypothetical protein TIFTF001_049918 [Ficus carica]GMN19489.1 hypothetical protein TIFTF001_049919 [Ficus carica]GMN19514.1 hypothetical protein TIFTF001_049923 [Ficus carica]GMN19528.1 hypothetical protein TIFTF001_049924 [Ficus carica]